MEHIATTADIILNEEKRNAIEIENGKIPTGFLRNLGVIIIVIASIIYLFQGANGVDPYQRHWIFLGITALFGALTWIVGGMLKEMKGARTFVALAVASVPVLSTQLGAMIYSIINGETAGMNPLFNFVPNSAHLGIIITATLIITVPIILIGNRILAKSQLKMLSFLTLLSNILLLIPFRHLLPVSIVLVSGVVLFLFYAVKIYHKDYTVRTKEGTFALIALFIPLTIIAIRTISFYDQGMVFNGLVWILVGISAVVLPRYRSSKAASTIQTIGIFSVIIGWFTALGVPINASYDYYVFLLPAALILSMLSFALKNGNTAIGLRRLAFAVLAGSLIIGQFFFSGSIPVIMTILGGISLLVFSAHKKEKAPFALGIFTTICGLIGLAILIATALSNSSWILLMFIGITIIIGGSLSEVFNNKWKAQIQEFKVGLNEWN